MSIICFSLISRIRIHPAILAMLCNSCGISMQYFPLSNAFDFLCFLSLKQVQLQIFIDNSFERIPSTQRALRLMRKFER